MARRRKTPLMPAPAPAPKGDDVYGMALSRERLEKEGFRPGSSNHAITQDVIDAWVVMVATREAEAEAAQEPAPPRMTRAFLLLREEAASQPPGEGPPESPFERLVTAQAVGPLILTHVFASCGHRATLNLALTSKRMWAILAGTVNYHDFFAGRLQNLGPSAVFVATAPRFTLQEIMATRLTDPYGLGRKAAGQPFTNWHNSALTREEDAVDTLYMVRKRIGDGSGPIPEFLERIFEKSTLEAIRAIEDPESIFKANQFISRQPDQVFEPQMIYAATRLQLLLIKLFEHRRHTRVLHFHQTPFFDRKILAIVLRASPRVTMLGVYNCPLIHFGDLIPILDLIAEINQDRRAKNKPLISAFDFYPAFHKGMTYPKGRRHFTYGLTADSMDLDIVQRGVYAILLKGYLKARRMKLHLLFDPGQALKAFLFQLPNAPLSIPTFFDGLDRYLDARATEVQRRHALFDLTKPIRISLETNLGNDNWYRDEMGSYLLFCSSCGYEMLFEFFPAGERRNYPHRRVCGGCTLQDLLDNQPHDMRDCKVGLLSKLMPEWNGQGFNTDAPTTSSGPAVAPENALMWLRSTATVRIEPSPLTVVNGELTATHHVTEFLRDNKQPGDSLQNLPSLRDLARLGDEAADGRWADLFNACNRADVYARARQRNQAEWVKKKGRRPEVPRDIYGESWHRERHAREVQTLNYATAVQLHVALQSKGW